MVFLGQSGILLVLYISLTHSTRCVLLLLLLTLPPVREVCPNHELVMFQPWTENSLYVGSFDILTLFIVSPSPPDSTIFWIFVFLPQAYSCLPPSVTIQRRSTLYLSPASPPRTRPGAESPSTWVLPPPASLHRSSLFLTPFLSSTFYPGPFRTLDSRATCLLMLCVSLVRSPPLFRLRPAPISLSDPRGFSFQGSLHPSAFLHRHHAPPPPPFQPQPAAHSPEGTKGVVTCYLSPCPL